MLSLKVLGRIMAIGIIIPNARENNDLPRKLYLSNITRKNPTVIRTQVPLEKVRSEKIKRKIVKLRLKNLFINLPNKKL